MLSRSKRNRRSLIVTAVVSAGLISLTGCSPVTSGGDQNIIRGVSLDNPASVQALYGIVGDADAARAGQQTLSEGATGTTRWAAIVAYEGDGADPAVLAPYVHDSSLSTRAAAAAGAVAMGDRDAFPVLIDVLGRDGAALGSDPPEALWQIADQALVRATAMATFGPPLDGSIEEARAAQAHWRTWWKRNGSSLTYNATDELWSTK